MSRLCVLNISGPRHAPIATTEKQGPCRDGYNCSQVNGTSVANATVIVLGPGASGAVPCVSLTTAYTQPRACPMGYYCPPAIHSLNPSVLPQGGGAGKRGWVCLRVGV